VVAAGTPEDVAEVDDSFTGQYLAPYLGTKKKKKKRKAV
jgi:excinuclease UvrABC ATPase subunit